MPNEAYKAFIIKQKKMQEMLKKITGKKHSIPLTKVFKVSAKEPTYLNDMELIKYFREKRRC